MKKKHLLIKIIILIIASGSVTSYVEAYDNPLIYSNNIEEETSKAISDEIPVASESVTNYVDTYDTTPPYPNNIEEETNTGISDVLAVASESVANYAKSYDTTPFYADSIEKEMKTSMMDTTYHVSSLQATKTVAVDNYGTVSDSGNCGNESGGSNVSWEYYQNTKTLVVRGSGATINGKATFYKYQSEIEHVVFTGDITKIGTSFLSQYSNIQTIDISALENLEEIGIEAFYKCQELVSISFPQSEKLTSIGESAFKECSKLTKADLSKLTKLKTLSAKVFRLCSSLEEVILPDSMQTIAQEAFYGCTKLSSINLSSNTLQSIGDRAFYSCTALNTIVFGDGLQTIGLAAFYQSGLLSMDLSKCVNLSSIGDEAFYDNEKLHNVTFPLNDKLKTLSKGLFKSCISLKEIDLSNLVNLETLNQQLLFSTNIEKITLPTRIKQIEINALSSTSTIIFNIKSQSAMEKWGDEVDTVQALQAFSPSLLKMISVHLDEDGILKVKEHKALSVTTNITLNDKAIPVKWQSDNDKIVRVDTDGTVEGIMEGSATITATIDTAYYASSLQATKTIIVDNYGKVSDSGNCGIESGGSNVSWKYYQNTKTLVVRGSGATINGKAAFNKYQSEIEHVVFTGDITKIGTSFLSQYPNIQTIDISALENLEEIGIEAFYKCQELVSISFPQSEKLTSIGESAFKECSKLTKANLSKLTKLKTLSAKVFRLCSSLEEVILPDSMQTIAQEAFYGCTQLSSINLSVAALESIETKSFVDCTKLTNIEFGSGIKQVGNLAFSNTGLLNVDMSKSTKLESLGSETFYNCATLTTVSFPTTNTSLTILNDGLFKDCSNLKKINITGLHHLETLALNVFRRCTSLEEVNLPATLKSIPTESFYQCNQLKEVNFEELTDLVSIEEAAFAKTALTKVNLSNSQNLQTIGNKAFMTSTSIMNVELPDSIKSIGGYAFANIENLKEIILPASLEIIGEKAFYVQNDWTAKYISQLVKVDFSKCDKLQVIYDSCFQDVSSLTFVDLGNCKSLTRIEEDFLRGTNVSKAILPDSITSIGRDSFNKKKMEFDIVSTNKEWGDTINTLQSLNLYSSTNGNCYLKLKELNLDKSTYSSGDEIKSIPTFENNITVNGLNIPLEYVISNSALIQINGDGKIITHCLKGEEKATSTIKASIDTLNWNSPYQSAEVNIEVKIVHHFNDWTSVELPTYDKDGLSQRICQDCFQTEIKLVDKLQPIPETPNVDKPDTGETDDQDKPDINETDDVRNTGDERKPDSVETGDVLHTFEYFLITMLSLCGVLILYRKAK